MSIEADIRQLVDDAVARAIGDRRLAWISVDAAAAELGITPRALRARIDRGWIARSDISKSGRRLFIRVAALNRRLEEMAG